MWYLLSYSKKWRAELNKFYLKSYSTGKYLSNLYKGAKRLSPDDGSTHEVAEGEVDCLLLNQWASKKDDQSIPSEKFPVSKIKHYKDQRDYPGIRRERPGWVFIYDSER